MRFFLIFLFLLFPSPAFAQTLPSEISDSDFWQLIVTLSEPSGSYPLSENFISNELRFQEILPALVSATKPGGVFIGVGPEQNFTYAAALRPGIAFIVDIRRENLVEHLLYKALFDLSPTRADFLSRLFSRSIPATTPATIDALLQAISSAPTDGDKLRSNLAEVKNVLVQKHAFALTDADLASLEKIARAFSDFGPKISFDTRTDGRPANPRSRMPNFMEMLTAVHQGQNFTFLANDERYRFVREMQRKNLLIPVVGDFAGPKALRAIGTYLKAHGAVVDVFYTSNVEQYLLPLARGGSSTKQKAFLDSVSTMPISASSLVVRMNGNPSVLPPMGGLAVFDPPVTESIADSLKRFNEGRIVVYSDLFKK